MKRLFVILAMAALIVPGLADARDRGFSPFMQGGQGQQWKRDKGDSQRGGRDFRREQEVRPRDDRPPPGRMTEEERRQLQRDLDRANREIYRRGPPR